MATKEEFEEPIIVEAHQVNTCANIAGIVRFTLIKLDVIPHLTVQNFLFTFLLPTTSDVHFLSNGVFILARTETGTGTGNKWVV